MGYIISMIEKDKLQEGDGEPLEAPRKKKIESSADEAAPKEDNPAGACIQNLLKLKYTSTPFLVYLG